MANMYVKIFSAILNSTVWALECDVRVVWITLLCLADETGFVPVTAPGIAKAALVPLARIREILRIFEGPDPDSRTPDHEGRRIEQGDGGYMILNYMKYRDMQNQEQQRRSNAARQKRFRERKKIESSNASVTGRNGTVTRNNDNQIKNQKKIKKKIKSDQTSLINEGLQTLIENEKRRGPRPEKPTLQIDVAGMLSNLAKRGLQSGEVGMSKLVKICGTSFEKKAWRERIQKIRSAGKGHLLVDAITYIEKSHDVRIRDIRPVRDPGAYMASCIKKIEAGMSAVSGA